MKLNELLKNDTIKSIQEGEAAIPSWFRQDKHSPEEIENKLKSYREALERYKSAGNTPMVTKMEQRIKEFENKQKETNSTRTKVH